MRHGAVSIWHTFLIAVVLLGSTLIPGTSTSVSAGTGLEGIRPSISVTKKRCAGRETLPVFVESHCIDVSDAVFELRDPRNIHSETLVAGAAFVPVDWYFAGSNLWNLRDLAQNRAGISVVSCLASEPSSGWWSSVPRVVQSGDTASVLVDWMPERPGGPVGAYRPSLSCVWFELPDMNMMPAVLRLQVFTTDTSYLHWTETTGSRLPDERRGTSGDDLEAAMVMSGIESGEVYSFTADASGQVMVPPGMYLLAGTGDDGDAYFTMISGTTTLVEVGLSSSLPAADEPTKDVETGMFPTGALICVVQGCSAFAGVTIAYASMDGSLLGSCVTVVQQTPWGLDGWCDYPFIEGVPTILTLDESTLPSGYVVTSGNPVTYLVPENPDGPVGPVYFEVDGP